MNSWLRHFILGVIIGIVSVIMMRILLSSVPGYDNDSNLLVVVFAILFYGVGTAVLGEFLMVFSRKN